MMYARATIGCTNTSYRNMYFLICTTLVPRIFIFFFLNDTAPTEFYPLPLHDALPISSDLDRQPAVRDGERRAVADDRQHVEAADDVAHPHAELAVPLVRRVLPAEQHAEFLPPQPVRMRLGRSCHPERERGAWAGGRRDGRNRNGRRKLAHHEAIRLQRHEEQRAIRCRRRIERQAAHRRQCLGTAIEISV